MLLPSTNSSDTMGRESRSRWMEVLHENESHPGIERQVLQ
jgi:hypothetical protein